jgi:phosphatidylinositol-3,4,5-trisphosphate 3-phosphatase/dual-specificity protein phosphatase PTEN
MLAFCRNLDIYLKTDPKNVGAVHCKAGKGRTGVMVCCYLAYSAKCKNAYEALRFYGRIRTKNEKGVTIPSQIRYIYYFDYFCKYFTKGKKNVELSTVKLP